MGFLSSVKSQFLPSPEIVESSHHAPELSHSPTAQEKDEIHDADIETIVKPAHKLDVEGGVARVEAIQAVWGKHGKYLIIAG